MTDKDGAGDHIRFNPRARRGRDAAVIAYAVIRKCFNPRARRGRDSPSPAILTRY